MRVSWQGGESVASLQLWARCKAEVCGGSVSCPEHLGPGKSRRGGILREVGAAEVRMPKKGINRSLEEGKGWGATVETGKKSAGERGSEAMGWGVSEWVGLGKLLCGRGTELWLASASSFASLARCQGEPITLPTVITDPDQLHPGLGKHMPSSSGEQTFARGKSI